MEVQKKLTRTNSSLLRSSPTIRSSIHSISSISEEEEEEAAASEEEKPHKSGSRVIRSNRVYLPIFCVLLTPLFFYFYLRKQDIPNSVNLILPLGFISILIFIAKKKRVLFVLVKNLSQLCFERNSRRRKASVEGGTGRSESVQWYIGNEKERCFEEKKVIIREGVQFYSNGDFYEGEFHKGKPNGSGVYTYFVNGRYEGDWIDGRYDGYGIESWAKGSRYRGQYRQGLRHGYGVYRFYTGDSYAGEWFNGQSHGVGVQTCSDGSCFVGEFKCGIKHGLGCYHFRNGDKYAGEYFGDKIHGFGVYHFANGHCYEGSWHEGRKQGFGIYTFRSGETKCGEWDVGILRSSVPQLTDSILRAVQAARKAAERAIHLKRVDDQVNRAVMAANRAATAARVAAIKAVQNRMDGKFCDTNL